MSQMNLKNNTRRAALIALASSTAITTAAPLVSAQDSDGFSLEEIVVTATRRSESVQDIPYNISAVSGADIEKATMVDAPELLRSILGIVSPDRGPRNSATLNSIRIRGLNVDGAARGDYAASSAPTVATYVNDTPLFTNMLLKDVERVEVLRGPQGTLALGGAVRFITKKPELGEFNGHVAGRISRTKASSDNNWAGDIVLNVPMGDTVALRAVASRIDTAGTIDYMNVYELDSNMAPVVPGNLTANGAKFRKVKDADSAETTYFRVSALWEPSETVSVNLMYSTQDDEADARRATAEGYTYGRNADKIYGAYEAGSVQLEPSQADTELLSAEVNVDLGFATLTSSTSHYDVEGNAISENTGFYAQKGWIASLYYNHPRPLARAADRRFADEAFVQELRLVSNNDGPLNYVVGAYYQDQDKSIGQTSTLAGYKNWASSMFGWMSDGYGYDDNDNDFIFDDVQSVKEKALFGEITYDVSDDLHITAGMRWFDSNVESDALVQLPFWDSLASWQAERTQTESGKKDVLFKFNVSYDMDDETMLYATVSEGYRRGGAASVPTTGNFAEDPAWLAYGSDTVRNFEVGMKGANDTMRYTASLFYVDWNNPQINTATANWGFFTVANGQEANTKGVELEFEGQLSEELHYTLGYAYVNAKLSEDFLSPTGAEIAADGNRTPGTPKHVLNVAMDYSTAVSGIPTVFRIDGYMQSKSQNYINNTHPLYGRNHSGFSIWNASALMDFENFDVTLFVKNIGNVKGTTASFSEAYMGSDPSQNYFGNGAKDEITLPRTIVAVRYDF